MLHRLCALLSIGLAIILAGCAQGPAAELLVPKDGGLVLLSATGQSRTLTQLPSGFEVDQVVAAPRHGVAAISGTVESSKKYDEYRAILIYVNGRNIQRFGAAGEDAWGPTWSPTGDRLAYILGESLVVKPFAGGRARRLDAVKPALTGAPVWSPKSDKILWSTTKMREDLPNLVHFWVSDAKSGRRRELAADLDGKAPFSQKEGGIVWNPWSPDGRTLAILTRPFFWPAGQPPSAVLRLYDMRTGKDKVISAINDVTWETLLPGSWSPDGSRFTYSSNLANPVTRQADLYVYSVRSGKTSLLTKDDLAQSGGYWSPDGRYIAFNASAVDRAKGAGLYMLSLDSREAKRLGPEVGITPYAWAR